MLTSCFHLFNDAIYKYDHHYISNVQDQLIILDCCVTLSMASNDFIYSCFSFLPGKFAAGSKQTNRLYHSFILAPCARLICFVAYTNLCKIIHLMSLPFFISHFFFGCVQFSACTHQAAALPRPKLYSNYKRLINMLRNQRKCSKYTYDFYKNEKWVIWEKDRGDEGKG